MFFRYKKDNITKSSLLSIKKYTKTTKITIEKKILL